MRAANSCSNSNVTAGCTTRLYKVQQLACPPQNCLACFFQRLPHKQVSASSSGSPSVERWSRTGSAWKLTACGGKLRSTLSFLYIYAVHAPYTRTPAYEFLFRFWRNSLQANAVNARIAADTMHPPMNYDVKVYMDVSPGKYQRDYRICPEQSV